MRRLFNLIFQLLSAVIVIFLFTAVWIVFDGLTDLGEKADVALVTGLSDSVPGTSDPELDRVVDLYKDDEFAYVIIMGTPGEEIGSASGVKMVKYLEAHGLPSNAIIANNIGENTLETAGEVAEIMKSHQFESVMIVTDYYRVTRMKLALSHEGVKEIQKAHVGKLQKEDAWKIGCEVVALYDYIGRVYLLPAAEKVKDEAQVGVDKAKADMQHAKEKVDKGLDNLPK